MVYTTQRIRVIPKPGDQPISIGGAEPSTPTPTLSPLDQLLQSLFPNYKPIEFPTPSTSPATGGIEDQTNTGGTDTGGTQGTGLGEGEIVNVEIPSSAASSTAFLMKTTFKNKGTTTQNFSLRILISPLGINTITPTISLTAGQQSIVESTIVMPNVQYGGNFPGAVELRTVTSSGVVLFQDSEAFTLAVVGSGTGTGGAAAAITPSSGTVELGQSISINCINFAANEVINFVAKIGSITVATDAKTAGATGAAVLNTLTFTGTTTGTAVITATGATSGKVATANVIVSAAGTIPTANIVPSPTTVIAGQSISIAASNFVANETINFVAKVGTTQVATGTMNAGSAGSVVLTGFFFLASSPAGSAVITATGVTSGRIATATVTVTSPGSGLVATIVPSSSTVKQGASISVACANFAALEVINFIAKVGTTTVATDSKTALSSGAVVLDTLTFLTSSPLGSAVIMATGATSGRIATATVTVTQADTPTPTPTPTAVVTTNKASYLKNENVIINGTGYGAGEQVKAYLTINALELTGSVTVVATSTGTFTATVVANTAGSGHAHGTGLTSTRHAQVAISVNPLPVVSIAAIVPSATTVKQGASISVACTNFGALEVINFIAKVGTTTVATDSKTTLSSGAVVLDTLTFSATAPIGSAVITATGATSGKVATATVTVQAATITPTPTAAITLGATSVVKGGSFTISATGFGVGEIIDFSILSGTTVIRADTKTAGSAGAVIDTMLVPDTAPTGTATVTAKGRTTLRVAPSKTINITAPPTTTYNPTINTNKSTYIKGEIVTISGGGFKPGESVQLSISIGGVFIPGTINVTASSTGAYTGGVNASVVGGGHAHARGLTTLIHVEKGINITTATVPVTAKITAPLEVHDGDTFGVTGTGFNAGEQVKTTVSGTWHSTNSTYNNKTFSASVTVTASSSGGFAVSVKTPEVPSGVSTTATIKSQGLTSGRIATRTISVI